MSRRAWVAVVLVLLASAAAGGWWRWGRAQVRPKLPAEVAVEDPAIAEAVDRARADVVARPGDAATWGRLGEVYLANGITDAARDCLAEAGRLDPGERRWPYLEGVSLLLRDPLAALPCWQRAAARPGTGDHARTARLRWAEALVEEERAAEAEPLLRAELDRDGADTRAHFLQGLIFAARGENERAVESLRRCADHPAARKKVAGRLAALYAILNRPAEAAEAARREVQLPPDADWPDPFREDLLPLVVGRDGLFLQAEKQQQLGNVRQATFLYEQVIRRYPTETRAYAKLGMLLAETGDYAAAEGVLRDGLKADPDMVQGHFFLAVALFHRAEREGVTTPGGQARLQQAAEEARRATELKPDHGFAYLYLGLALKHLGRRDEAVAALRTAARTATDSADPHLHLGQMLAEGGNVREGTEELEAAVRLSGPNDPRSWAALERIRSTPVPKTNP